MLERQKNKTMIDEEASKYSFNSERTMSDNEKDVRSRSARGTKVLTGEISVWKIFCENENVTIT